MGFLSALASYGIVLLVFVAVGGLAIFAGITLRKRKDQKEGLVNDTEELQEKQQSLSKVSDRE